MALIQVKTGSGTPVVALGSGEPAFDTTNHILYVGDGTTNTAIGGTVTSIVPYTYGGTNASTSWTSGSILYAGASTIVQDNAALYWDGTIFIAGLAQTTGTAGFSSNETGTVSQMGDFSANGNGTSFNIDDSLQVFEFLNHNSVTTFEGTVNMGIAAGYTGLLQFANRTGSNYIGVTAPASASAWTLTLPGTAGTNGYPLLTDGTGVSSWTQLGTAGLASNAVTYAKLQVGSTNSLLLGTPSTGTAFQEITLGSGLSIDHAGVLSATGSGGTVTSVTGTTNQIDVATGTSTPVISLHSGGTLPGAWALGTPASGVLTNATGYPGDSSLVTVGTITTGVWNGTRLTSSYIPTDVAYLDVQQTFTKGQAGSVVTLTDASTIAVDLSLGNNYTIVLGGNRTLGTPTNIQAGQSGSIQFWQDGTGSRTLVYNWMWQFANQATPSLSTGIYNVDELIYEVLYYGTNTTVTTNNATPSVLTWTAHGMVSGQLIQFPTGAGTTPAVNVTYYVHVINANTFHIASTLANLQAGTYLHTVGIGGNMTAVTCSIQSWLNQYGATTNLTGVVTSVGTVTSFGSFTSATLATAITDETGSGSAVFATSPTLVTPLLGTPTSGNLVNCTGYVGTSALVTIGTITNPVTFTPAARTSGSASYFTINAPADTGISTTAESIGINHVGATRTWVDGTVATQREYVFQAPTYNKTTTSATFTKAATLAVSAAPVAGSGVTLTSAYSIWAQAGRTQLDGGLGLTVGSDATGDIWYRNSSGVFARLGIGSSNNVLIVASGLPAWSNSTGISSVGTITGGVWNAGEVISTGAILTSSTNGVGYETGVSVGGTVTQLTSRTTGVTLSKPTGAITLFAAAGSTTAATFTVTNTTVATVDTIIVNQKSGTNVYLTLVTAVAAGSFNITFFTTGGTSSDSPVFNFTVIKGSNN